MVTYFNNEPLKSVQLFSIDSISLRNCSCVEVLAREATADKKLEAKSADINRLELPFF